MTVQARLALAFLLLVSAPAFAHRTPPPPETPTCAELATDPKWGLAGNPAVTNLTAVVTPAVGTNLSHCQVDFTDVSLEGRRYGYLEDQTSKFRIRVGLPLS